MEFTPKQLRRQVIAAAKRVKARGDTPPWKRHPDVVTLSLAITGELSAREARWVRNHLASCRMCVERKERMARELKKPADSRMVAETLRILDRLLPGDAKAR